MFERQRGLKSGVLSEKITDSILFMIARDYQPIQMVENEGFVRLVKMLVPLYNLPSRATFTSRLYEKFGALKAKYRGALEALEEIPLPMGMDIWIHKHTTKGYLGITGHFLDDDLVSLTIGVIPLDSRHTSAYISSTVVKVFNKSS